VAALQQGESGTKVAEVCRKTGISEATFYNWKKQHAGLGISELRELRRREYNQSRPHRALGERTPNEFASQVAASRDLTGLEGAENSL
jgi:putative transposase